MTVDSKMTAIADEIRVLSGTTDSMGLDLMASHIGDANDNIDIESDLILQITDALNNKAGGTSLNFKIICNPQPNTAEENTIWIDTDKINNYYFSVTQPENMVDYDVWFCIGTISPADFNALKKNGIQVYPLYAQQYIDGTWVTKTAKSYQDGKWVEWIDYIYNRGETEYTFSSVAKKSSSSSTVPTAAPKIAMNADHVEISITHATSGSKGRVGLAYITEKIDLTNINTLVFEGDFYQTYNVSYPKIAIFSTFGTYMDNNVVAEKTNIVSTLDAMQTHLVELDVSNISGENYIGFKMMSETGASSATSYIKLRQIYKK